MTMLRIKLQGQY